MARKPGKPKVPKRTAKPKRIGKSGAKVRRARVVAEPVVGEESELDLDTEATDDKETNAPIEVSEFRPVESTDDEPATSAEPEADTRTTRPPTARTAALSSPPIRSGAISPRFAVSRCSRARKRR